MTARGAVKRILFVIDGLPGGGAERVVVTLAGELAARGNDVSIANLRDVQSYVLPPGVRLIPCFDTAPYWRHRVGEIGRRAGQLNQALAEFPDWDLVISSLLTSDRIVRRSRVGDRAWYNVPSVLSVQFLAGAGRLKKARRVARLRSIYDDDRVIAVSQSVARDLTNEIGLAPARIEVIHNPFRIKEIQRLAAEPCELEGSEYLVSVGRFDPAKRPDRLLGAFARSGFAGRLVLLGTGTQEQIEAVQRRVLELDLQGRVALLGFQSNPYPYMRHARALVLSSDREGFGNVLVEALICGTPVVSTRCPGGVEEILTGTLSVGLADLTEEGLATAIDRVLESPPSIEPGHYSRFDVRKIADRYLALAEPEGARARGASVDAS